MLDEQQVHDEQMSGDSALPTSSDRAPDGNVANNYLVDQQQMVLPTAPDHAPDASHDGFNHGSNAMTNGHDNVSTIVPIRKLLK